jgi:hypothetical protein
MHLRLQCLEDEGEPTTLSVERLCLDVTMIGAKFCKDQTRNVFRCHYLDVSKSIRDTYIIKEWRLGH